MVGSSPDSPGGGGRRKDSKRICFLFFSDAAFLTALAPECLMQHLKRGEVAEWTDHQQDRGEQHRQRQRLRSQRAPACCHGNATWRRVRARQGSDTVDRRAASASSWSGCWGGPGGAAMARGPAGGAASACLEDLDRTRWPAGGSPLQAFLSHLEPAAEDVSGAKKRRPGWEEGGGSSGTV